MKLRNVSPTEEELLRLDLGGFFEEGEEEFGGSGDVKSSPNSRSFVKELALKHESLRNDFNDLKLYVFKKLDYLSSSMKLVMEKLGLEYIDSDVDSEDDIVFVMKKKKDDDGDNGGAASGGVGYFVMFHFWFFFCFCFVYFLFLMSF